MPPYIVFDNNICPFQVLPTLFNGLSPSSQLKMLASVVCPANREEDVHTAVLGRFAKMDDALHCVTHLLFDRLRSLILNRGLNLEGKK